MGVPLSSSSNATDSAHDRKSSYASSAWSVVNKDTGSQESASDAMSVRSESKPAPSASDEKELYDFDGIQVRHSPATGNLGSQRPSLDWRSPFASPDPLSMSFEQASAMILAGDDDDEIVSSAVRSRSGTGSTVFVDANSRNEQSASGLGVTSSEDDEQSVDVSTATLQPIPKLEMISGDHLSDDTKKTETNRSATPTGPLKRRGNSVHLSPKSTEDEYARRKRNHSISTVIVASENEDSATEPNERTAQLQTYMMQDSAQSPSEARSASDAPDTKEVEVVRPSNEFDHQRATKTPEKLHVDIPTKKSIPPWPAFDVGLSSLKENSVADADPPSMPRRQPPPPPPKPRRTREKVRLSSYRIVNASPIEDISSDDELYTTSKPSSPITQTRTAPAIVSHMAVPKVSIDASACEEDNSIDQEALRADQQPQYAIPGPQNSTEDQTSPNLFASALRSKFSVPVLATSEIAVTELQPVEGRTPQANAISRRHSIALPASQDALEDEAPTLPPRPQPPPVPQRPLRQRYKGKSRAQDARPSPSTIQTSPAALQEEKIGVPAFQDEKIGVPIEKEIAPESGLEVRDKLKVTTHPNYLRSRVSVDAALNVGTSTLSPGGIESLRDATKHLRSASSSQVETTTTPADYSVTGFYGPGIDDSSSTELDRERIEHIVYNWNHCKWDEVHAYLTEYLAVLIEGDSPARARRINHLLGVCASFKGEWLRAIPHFISAMRTPVKDIADLDDGDCAAAYWLGDTYALLNKRTEALMAYCIAERSSFFSDPIDPTLSELMTAEQDAVQLGQPKTDFNTLWAQQYTSSAGESILNASVVSLDAARMLYENEPRRAATRLGQERFQLTQTTARSNALFRLCRNQWVGRFHRMKITPANFEPDTPWPMQYDPMFNMANVHRGRLLAYECDLLAVFTTNVEAKISRAGPLGLSRMDCFTCSNLRWLIQTLREGLKMLEMEFSEVANVEGTWFVARYTFMQDKIATTYYFSIALFKQTLRSGYGVEICPDGICSARIVRASVMGDYDKGVHVSESKRIKKMVREYLDEAAKQRPKSKRKESASNSTPTGAVLSEPENIPPLPPRTYV